MAEYLSENIITQNKKFYSEEIKMEHGHWIHDIHNGICDHEYTCSECRWGFDNPYDMYISVEEYNYCPHCGAKMDEGEDK